MMPPDYDTSNIKSVTNQALTDIQRKEAVALLEMMKQQIGREVNKEDYARFCRVFGNGLKDGDYYITFDNVPFIKVVHEYKWTVREKEHTITCATTFEPCQPSPPQQDDQPHP